MAVGLALTVRVAAILWVGPERLEFGDARDYLATARVVCEEGRYPDHGNLPFFRAPGLPLFAAAVTDCEPEHRAAWVKGALALVDVGSVVLVVALARAFGGSRRLGFAVGFGAALYPLFVVQVTDVRSEPLAMFFGLLSLLLLLRLDAAGRIGSAVGSGAALAAATLVRPVFLVVAVAWIAYLLSRYGRSALRPAALFACGFALFLAPWTVRNANRYGELILVNDGAGYNFWRSTHPALAKLLKQTDRTAFWADAAAFEGGTTTGAVAAQRLLQLSPRERERWFWREGWRQLDGHVSRLLAVLGRNVLTFWRPWLSPLGYPDWEVLASGALLVPLYGAALVGWVLLVREKVPLAVLVGAHLLVVTVAHAPFQAILRYRVPLTDPLLLILAALALGRLAARWRDRAPLTS